MKSRLLKSTLVAGFLVLSAQASASGLTYQVTITNLTKGQIFTPVFVASVKPKATLFQYGEEASQALSNIAEGGDSSLLKSDLEAAGSLGDSVSGSAPVGPGQTQQFTITGGSAFKKLILSAMMLPTNDAFIAINGLNLPRRGSKTFLLNANDAGSESNDELFVSIPGPFAGAAFSPNDTGEGFVHVHNGIHGVGDLATAEYDWRNPVARVVVKRVRH